MKKKCLSISLNSKKIKFYKIFDRQSKSYCHRMFQWKLPDMGYHIGKHLLVYIVQFDLHKRIESRHYFIWKNLFYFFQLINRIRLKKSPYSSSSIAKFQTWTIDDTVFIAWTIWIHYLASKWVILKTANVFLLKRRIQLSVWNNKNQKVSQKIFL